MRPRWLGTLLRGWPTMIGWLVGAGLTAWIVWGPLLPFAVYSPRAHLVVHTVDVCVSLLAAYLAHGRFVRGRRLGDLLLAHSLVILAMAGTMSLVLPSNPDETGIWLPAMLRLVAAVLLLATAMVPAHRTLSPGSRRWTALGPVLVLLAGSAVVWLLRPVLPVAMDLAYSGDHVHPELLTSHPVLIGSQLFSAACLLLASHLFTVRSLSSDDELLRWLGPACALGAFARICYALTPTLYTEWFYTGDLLRTGFYVLLLVGAARELSRYWTARTVQAVTEDRQRLARELHDGVVQELTYIRGEAYRIEHHPDLRERIVGATDRAVDEARTAIHALGSPDAAPLGEMLRRAAHELSRRHGIRVEVDADETVHVDPDQLHTLLRIAREAVTNAARHGRAELVHVCVRSDEDGRVLEVADDGVGFDAQAAMKARNGYGLVSMSERARALPGTLSVNSRSGSGSKVQVMW